MLFDPDEMKREVIMNREALEPKSHGKGLDHVSSSLEYCPWEGVILK